MKILLGLPKYNLKMNSVKSTLKRILQALLQVVNNNQEGEINSTSPRCANAVYVCLQNR